jgi:hypothetical protein
MDWRSNTSDDFRVLTAGACGFGRLVTGGTADEFVSAESRQTHGERFRNVGHNGLTVHELDLVVHTDLCGKVSHSRKGTLGLNMDHGAQV